jgi:NADH-quinone oxidoreductase subunit M
MPICILASWESIEKRVKEYMIAFLVLETLMIGVFCALDLVLFYVFFEGGLIPMFLIIGVWGGKRRVYASFKFFLYTLLGSVLMLLAIMACTGRPARPTSRRCWPTSSRRMQTWLWLAFFASFAVKMPMWPVHTWLPDAHVEAPTAGSVILAGILLKMGGYGFLRFSLPMFPDASSLFRAAGLHALGHRDHLHLAGRADAGGHEEADRLFVRRPHGLRDHGHLHRQPAGACRARSSRCCQPRHRLRRALPLRRRGLRPHAHARDRAYGGLVNRMPLYAVVFMLFTMANVGLPGTSGFVGEFLTLLGAFKVNTWVAFFATTGVILSAAYALWLYRRSSSGCPRRDARRRRSVYQAKLIDRRADPLSKARRGEDAPPRCHCRLGDRSSAMTLIDILSQTSPAAGDDPRRRRHGAADGRRLRRRDGARTPVTGWPWRC